MVGPEAAVLWSWSDERSVSLLGGEVFIRHPNPVLDLMFHPCSIGSALL